MYKIMMLYAGLDDWKTADTGYGADDLEEADDLRNELLKRNPGINFVVGTKEQERWDGRNG